MPTVRIQEKNYSESIMVLKLKDGALPGSDSGSSWIRLNRTSETPQMNDC